MSLRKLIADTVEDLPILGIEHKGVPAIVGKGIMTKQYAYIWDFKKEEGHWVFQCYVQRKHNET